MFTPECVWPLLKVVGGLFEDEGVRLQFIMDVSVFIAADNAWLSSYSFPIGLISDGLLNTSAKVKQA